jgi:pantoate--beta-alanine ligase
MTETVTTLDGMHAWWREWRRAGLHIAFVPTMGNLHYGHLTLVEAARKAGDRVVVSIFVNPTQFGPTEDYLTYPSTLEADYAKLEEMGVDLLFAPSVPEMYPDGHHARTVVQVPALSTMLCGEFRPGHFTGVATVVNKLFNIVQPDVAVFGTKDFQQLAVIRRMVRELSMPVEIVGAPIAREQDGLAMSSRNMYLGAKERKTAPLLYRLLGKTRDAIAAGERHFAVLEEAARNQLEAAGFRPDYYSVRRAEDLLPPTDADRALVVLAAAWLGKARLIDNLEVTAPG